MTNYEIRKMNNEVYGKYILSLEYTVNTETYTFAISPAYKDGYLYVKYKDDYVDVDEKFDINDWDSAVINTYKLLREKSIMDNICKTITPFYTKEVIECY